MIHQKIKQLQFECNTWKRALAFMVEENNHLKIRLSEILAEEEPAYVLNEIEEFQNRFIKIDELIRILRNDVAELEQFIDEKREDAMAADLKISNKLNRIRLNIPLVDRQLERMKMDFNCFLLVAIK